ncbi:MAG: hypothetical protein EXR21_00040 [Flavobacteriaceae bacterium]|nr:hypothetical protein [Flavobacteriaceae bacterium]
MALVFFCKTTVFAAVSDSLTPKKIIPSVEYQLQLGHVDFSPGLLFPLNQDWVLGGYLHNYLYTKLSSKPGTYAVGASVLGRYNATNRIFVQAEYSWFNIPIRQDLDLSYRRGFKADLMIGGGYRQPINQKFSAQVSVLCNVLHNVHSPYESRLFFRAGLNWNMNPQRKK